MTSMSMPQEVGIAPPEDHVQCDRCGRSNVACLFADPGRFDSRAVYLCRVCIDAMFDEAGGRAGAGQRSGKRPFVDGRAFGSPGPS